MEIDIRNKKIEVIDRIRFDNTEDDALFADSIWRYSGDCNVWLSKSDEENAILGIKNKDAALNLLAAINKAIDLGWFE